MKPLIRSLYIGGVLLLVVQSGQAGTFIRAEKHSVGDDSVIGHTTHSIQTGRIRIDVSEGKTEESTIFDSRAKVLWFLDHGKKTYTEMTEEDIQEMREQMEEAMEALKEMPPAMREMMKGKMPGMAEIKWEKGEEGQKAGDFTCTIYRLLMGGQLLLETCNARGDAVRITQDAVETMRALGEMMKPLVESMPGRASGMQYSAAEGFPVRTRYYENGQAKEEDRVVAFEERDLADSVFTVPAGYKKKKR